ncbi:DUF488 domain-containing protein [Kineococcus arenarius]|uniref:DUF488 domain-containing protein n=1 Tax=Kineococcus sp. SYSU DK007 TaxID=3383128 RepID=UPI003D7CE514
MRPPLRTLGHGRTDRAELGRRLADAGVGLLVDVRRFPGSRTSPDVARDALREWLPQEGVAYRWEPRLGGRRHVPAGTPEVDTWWTVAAFRAYAAHTRTPEFTEALDDLLAESARTPVAVMCSEGVWWRCHRRLIADVAVLGRGVDVEHVMPDGRTTPHPVAAGARRGPDGLLVWNGAQDVPAGS